MSEFLWFEGGGGSLCIFISINKVMRTYLKLQVTHGCKSLIMSFAYDLCVCPGEREALHEAIKHGQRFNAKTV